MRPEPEPTKPRGDASSFFELVEARRGHFQLESGHHSQLWLDLDALFANPRRIEPLVAALTDALRPYAISMVCGPLLGGAFLAQLVAQALGVEFCFTRREMPTEGSGLYRARYVLPRAFASRVRDKSVAIIDDVMSAGSALRGTFGELRDHGATPVVAGALLVLGSGGMQYFAQQGIAVEAVHRAEFNIWDPNACPLCAAGAPLESLS